MCSFAYFLSYQLKIKGPDNFASKNGRILHTVFELSENTKTGMWFINTYLKAWPGGKSHADTWFNILGDTIYAMLGWVAADWSLKYYT